MGVFLICADKVAIELYESDILPDTVISSPEQSKEELDAVGCIFDSNCWNDQISPKEVLRKLITDERMIGVWSKLKDRAAEALLPINFYINFSIHISNLYKGPSDWDLLTPTEKDKKIERIGKLALELCQQIANTPLDHSVMEFENHESYFNLFKKHCSERNEHDVNSVLNTSFVNSNGEFFPKTDNYGYTITDLWCHVGVHAPSISSVLQSIYYKSNSEKYDSILKRKAQIRRTYFIRSVSEYFKWFFGLPLHEITAAISSVFLDDEITVEHVRSAIR